MKLNPVQTLDLIRSRHSIRKYLPDAVPRTAVDRCIEAARLAPSANNGQPWEFIIVGDETVKTRLARAARFGILRENPFAAEAPIVVAVVETPGHRPTSRGGLLLGKNFPQMDLGMAVENFCLQATAEGLGSCILGLFLEKDVRRALKMPPNRRVRLLVTLGFPAEETRKEKKRRKKEEMSRYIEGKGIDNAS